MQLLAARPVSIEARVLGIVLAVGGLVFFGQSPGSVAIAQDPAETVPDEMPKEKAATEAPPPAANNNAGASTAAPAGSRQSYLGWLYSSLGLLYSVIFLGLSFALVAVFVMNMLTARREHILPAQLIEGFEAQLNAKNYQGAYELAKGDESFLGK